MRSFFVRILFLVLMPLLLVPVAVRAADSPRKHNPWAHFAPGAWRQTRMFVQIFDKDGRVVDWGVTEERTTLDQIDEREITLRVERSVWMAGKWCDQPPEIVKRGFYGESEGQQVTVKDLDPEMVLIEERNLPCAVREVQVTDPKLKSVQCSRIVFNNDVSPYVLKRTTTIVDPEQKTTLSETNTAVAGLDMLCSVADQLYSVSQSRTTTKHALGTAVSLTYASTEVPGGVVHECTKKLDKEGRLVERSTMELTDHGLKPTNEPLNRRHLPRRLRNWRLRAENNEKKDKPAL